MSKSYDNYIQVFEEPGKMKKQIARIKTDSLPPEAPKATEGSLLFEIYENFATPEQIEEMRAKYAKGIGWGYVKEELFQVMDAALSEKREKYKQLIGDRSYVDSLLKAGAEKARAKAGPFLHRIRKEIGIDG
jgi:tryptophanyl-tRNA synthetase